MLSLQNIHVGYDRADVLNGVTLEVPAGQIVAVMGHNGAGKTTLAKTAVGLLTPRTGRVLLDGEDVTKLRPHQRVKRGISYVPQGQLSFPQLTTAENLQVVADGVRGGGEMVALMYERFPVLREFAGRKAGLLSGGQRQQLAIARALITGPRLLILDEPTEGIQPSIVAEIERHIVSLAADGLTVLLVEQHVGFALTASSQYAVMASGRITSHGEGGAAATDAVRAAMTI
ncbi:urea transport system ATP-binding protein [Kineosphaera limosa]|uniref:Putative ABC transporter ATP-binding protein n=1 Tax=Kineosphaera limosa NBRC 100340 TaxID=1184609 RepID=K6X0N7_9MICO|nr:urea ABC transporter ATP-binding subunit UrtE [Kineosphaera limosa]NYE00413.1 urea transport system ATP-binding protein [Kineosphaera limosa]GAB97917.1 putative ABC transporter ATP-binding protein [Kineosphaera limosa NBRC 100340]